MDALYNDIIYIIYTLLPLSDAYHLSLAAKRFSHIFGSPLLWRSYVSNRIEPHTSGIIQCGTDKLTLGNLKNWLTLGNY